MPQTFTRLFYHVVFSTKRRAALIQPAWEGELYSYIGGIVRNRRAELIVGGGTEDHVHLLIRWPTTVSVSDMLRDIKTNSSAWRHDAGDENFAWQNGYGCFSVSPEMVDTVANYIAHQKEHHGKVSFQDEFREIVLEHGLELDEEHMWD